ncbi:sulfatase-like hydrolase/transferase [Parabacteroides sp. BX2]|jgi:arylsulfatase A-like enzyme|uniref:Sulfatase-like hydrolase/transferase n=1 Tax=Parabacteroides segnis TaxID=2763058 RepID=A0ABR7DZ20_9BACT|nr:MULTISPECIES: sulfatase-like hydrolase/transferase [Parabacteroides]MBC5642770.1 sulfatase-like hydrolase/transferase [Parabacteroides segnis]MCM0713798.1 sulfatase-like hydrolase/transferase [Parabacteroides sp. TA-V-105]
MRKVFYSIAALSSLSCSLWAKGKEAKNILFLLVDDMQKTCIHAYGNNQVVSPNIDGIIDQGVSFMHTYTNGSLGGALSMPSRAMIMTGRGVYQVSGDGAVIPEQHVTLPELLRNNGYETFATGKWHADKKSFNRSFVMGDNIFFGGMHSYETNGHVSPRLNHYDPEGKYDQPFTGEKFSSEMFADAAVGYLNKRSKKDKPFFAFVAFTSPHDPRMQHPDYGHDYKADDIELPVNYLPQHPFDNGELKIRDEVLLPFPRTEEMVKKDLADYYGMVSEVDYQIGRILNTLKEKGELDNTIIVFASDNGLAVGRHGLLGKQNLYEHSVCVPMAMVIPGTEKGIRKDVDCYLYDIYPTLCDLLKIAPAESVTGKSLVPVLNGSGKHRDQLFLAYSSFQRALVKDGWKYIIYNVDGTVTEQLFNLQADPDEMVNLAYDAKYEFKKQAYKRVLKEEMKKNNDFCNLDQHFWIGKPGKMPWSEASKLYVY